MTQRVSDYLHCAEELIHFAQPIELVSGAVGREFVAKHVGAKRKEICTCHGCGKVGRVQADCQILEIKRQQWK